MSNPIKQFIDLEKGKELKYWDNDKVLLSRFVPKDSEKEVRIFRKKPEDYFTILKNENLIEVANYDNGYISEFVKPDGSKLEGYDAYNTVGKHLIKIPSRSLMSSIREPFEIEPWNRVLVDKAVEYGQLVDNDKEAYLSGRKSGDEILIETKYALAKILKETNLIWVARSQMVCHPDSLIYGEIDEIWFDQVENKYYVGDTKTSSAVNKIGYWYQLGIYIEILKRLNPSIADNISNVAIIQWVRVQSEKWKMRDDFKLKDENGVFINPVKRYEYSKWILDNPEGKKPETIEKAKAVIEEIDLEIMAFKSNDGSDGEEILNKVKKYEESKSILDNLENGDPNSIATAKDVVTSFEYDMLMNDSVDNEVTPNDEIYWWKWDKNKRILDTPEIKNELVTKDLEQEGVLELVRNDIEFISKYNITSKDDFEVLIRDNKEARQENILLQSKYDLLKTKYEDENKNFRNNSYHQPMNFNSEWVNVGQSTKPNETQHKTTLLKMKSNEEVTNSIQRKTSTGIQQKPSQK